MKGKHVVMLVLLVFVAVFGGVGYAQEKKTEAQTEAAQTPPPEVAVADAIQKDVPGGHLLTQPRQHSASRTIRQGQSPPQD